MKVALQCPKPEWVFLASIDSFTFYCIEAKVAKKIENNYINRGFVRTGSMGSVKFVTRGISEASK